MEMEILNGKRIMPYGAYLLVEKKKNPYMGGNEKGFFMNIDEEHKEGDGASGQVDDRKEFISFGIVKEVGSHCKDVEVGDEIFFRTDYVTPVPIGDCKLIRIGESHVTLIIR